MKNKEDARTRCVHVLFAINPESKKHKIWKWQVFWLTPVIERLPDLVEWLVSLLLNSSFKLSTVNYQLSTEIPVAKVLFNTFSSFSLSSRRGLGWGWSLQQRVLFRNLTGFPFINPTKVVSIPKSATKVWKIFFCS